MSDVAGRRIREARQRRGWTVKDLAERCAQAGAPHITSTVITNLETRRRSTREITVDEVLVLARVLGVAPLQLIVPLAADEQLQIVPGVELGPMEAVNWIAGDTPQELLFPARTTGIPELTVALVRMGDGGSTLNTIRQIATVIGEMVEHNQRLADDPGQQNARSHEEVISIMADRLMHLAARMESQGYDPPGLGSVREILQRRGLPATLQEWRDQTLKATGPGERGKTGESDGLRP